MKIVVIQSDLNTLSVISNILGKGRSRTFPEPYMEFPKFNEAFNLLL